MTKELEQLLMNMWMGYSHMGICGWIFSDNTFAQQYQELFMSSPSTLNVKILYIYV